MSTFIFESNKIESILDFVDPKTLFIFDIDHTLIEPLQVIGSTHWEKHLTHRLIDEGMHPESARLKACGLWKEIQKRTGVQAIESGIYRLITILKERAVMTLGLTSRDHDLADLTFRQLKAVDLDQVFTFNHPAKIFNLEYTAEFKNGTLFCGHNAKDLTLGALLKHAEITPEKIIFIDDQKDHLYKLEEMSFRAGIEFIGMQYTASSHDRFNIDIASIQEKHLPNILSDDEALMLLRNASQ